MYNLDNIEIIEENKPTKEEAAEMINRLCEYLEKNWYFEKEINP